MKLDKDSFDVIIGMTVLMVGLISVILFFIHNRYISWPLAGLFFLFLLFVIWFHRVPSRTAKGDETVMDEKKDYGNQADHQHGHPDYHVKRILI